jgi:aldehyde dehydrogenase (NAD+)
VLSVLPGGPQAGASLVEHPGVNKISFTGGAATGRKIAVACASQLKPLVLELGGKSANVVFDDADLDKAVEVAARIVGLAGQACTLPSRILVQEGIYDEFLGRVAAAIKQVPVGDPMDPATLMGPVITADACTRVLSMVERAAAEPGVEVLTGGGRVGGDLADGFYVQPTVVSNVAPEAEIALQEVFGPVTAATRFTDEEEAVAMANATTYGLAGYVHTRDVSRALRMASALEAGNIGVNGGDAPAGPGAPFGGVKESGYGREGGLNGLLEFVNVKNVLIETS